jgi:3-keto-disaccharide hydrolase
VPAADGGASAGLTKIFDGTGWDNWVYDARWWKIVDGAMVGKSTSGQSQAFTKADYSSFRLILESRMVNGEDHLGVCLWGSRPGAGSYGFGGCLLVIPPNGAIWDYLNNKDNPTPRDPAAMKTWHKTEILANRMTGHVQVATDGKLVHDYHDSAANLPRRKAGPIGMQIHKTGTESEYRNIEIEVDPKNDKLLTVP